MTEIPIPRPDMQAVGANGRLAQPVYDFLKAVRDSLTGAGSTLSGLGTAAVKNIGTSGGTVPLLDTQNDWSKQQRFPMVTLASPSAWDLDPQQVAFLSLTADSLLANPSNMRDGGTYILEVQSNGYALTYDTAYAWPGDIAPTLTTTAGRSDIIAFVARGARMRGSIVKNYPAS